MVKSILVTHLTLVTKLPHVLLNCLMIKPDNDTTKTLPPNVGRDDCVILFDGVCKLCNGWANFIIEKDRKHFFKLCSVQSPEGVAILKHFGFPTEYYNTMLYIEGAQCYQQSQAFFKVTHKLTYPWKAAGLFRILPQALNNWLYDRIALNRYKLFGKYDYCRLPTPDHQQRFLNSEP